MNTPPDNNPKSKYGIKKPSLALIPPASLLHEAIAFHDGAAKYGPYNWRENKVSGMVYLNAAMRHLGQYLDGENFDPVSKAHHLGHAKACLSILLDALETGNLIDDRPVKGVSSDMIKRFLDTGTLEKQESAPPFKCELGCIHPHGPRQSDCHACVVCESCGTRMTLSSQKAAEVRAEEAEHKGRHSINRCSGYWYVVGPQGKTTTQRVVLE
jgi:hypothetical protein